MSDLYLAFQVPVSNYPLDLPTAPARPREFSRDILAEVAAKHRMKPETIKSGSKLRPIVIARHEAMWEMRRRTALSLPQIARAVGLTDHTSVIHGLRRHEQRMMAK